MNSKSRIVKLPIYRGYTLDIRLNEFRRADYDKKIVEFIDFESKKGLKLLKEYYKHN